MGLYLCIFDGEDELEGVEVGRYSDFAYFRSTVTELLEEGESASRFPTLINHSDCDGEWSPDECVSLKVELSMISAELRQLPARQFASEWQNEVAATFGLEPSSLYDSFIDVDGEPLLERLIQLCDIAIQKQRPILFQ